MRCVIWSARVLLDAASACAQRQRARRRAPIVYTAEVDGIIHPVAAAYIRARDCAGRRRRAPTSLVIMLRTPGGLVDSTRDINTAIIQAKTPVAVFVVALGQPRRVGRLPDHHRGRRRRDGARHAHRRGASRCRATAQKVDDTMAKKMTSDVAGYARTLATQRKRNVELVEQAVTESRTFTEQEAVSASRRSSTSSRPICPTC